MQAFNYYIIKQDFVDSELLEERSFPDDRSHNTRIHKSPWWSPFPWSVQVQINLTEFLIKFNLYFMTLHAKIFLAF